MPRVPFLGRLFVREYIALILSFFIIAFEALIRIVTLALPRSVIQWFYNHSRRLFHKYSGRTPPSEEKRFVERLRCARNFEELCRLHGYKMESHVVETRDGYMLGLHRIPNKKGESARQSGGKKPVVYLHHGLLMNSEVWVCLPDAEKNIPFVLAEKGYDVWMGNNRGNKYSKKSRLYNSSSTKFWNFSIDEFSMFDIPDTINYIIDVTKVKSLSYVGFSQGTAQAFAALSLHPSVNEVVDVFIALAPAMSPKGLSNPIVDALMKSGPTLMYLFFGRKAILSSVAMWQSILYPPIFVKIIDTALYVLFNWRVSNIDYSTKLAAYAHLYSFASVKAVVHWFQIMRTGAFLMYDDDAQSPLYGKNSYHPARFPTRNIKSPIVLIYGDCDSLLDIDVILQDLPPHTEAQVIHGYEHIDVLWGRDVNKTVIPKVCDALKRYSGKGINGAKADIKAA